MAGLATCIVTHVTELASGRDVVASLTGSHAIPQALIRIGRRAIRSRAMAVIAVLSLLAIAVPSLVWSVVHTASSPATAYFVTTTRLWELALGGLVACGVAVWASLPRLVGSLLVVLGLVVLLTSLFVVTSSTPWPGSAALLPTVGTALVRVGGARARGPVVRLLGSAPMLWVGALSYSLYLWHWPLVTVVEQGVYEDGAPMWASVAAVLADRARHAHARLPEATALVVAGGVAANQAVRAALSLQDGDELQYDLDGDRVILRKARRAPAEDPFAAVDEWDSDADRKAYAGL